MEKKVGIAFDLEGPIVNVESFHFDAFIAACKEGNFETDFATLEKNIPYLIGGAIS